VRGPAARFAPVLLLVASALAGCGGGTVSTGGGTGGATTGQEVFQSANCGTCHTLAAAGASGTVGPSLDTNHDDAATIQSVVHSGKGGTMPSFASQLSDAQIAAVANYIVSSRSGR
jgi:mono/diheme cytochrome c family protein